jgi:NTE family protein
MYAAASGDERGFVLYLQHQRTWMNSLGGQWRNEIQFGSGQSLTTSFYQPLDVAQRFFVEPKAFWERDWENVFYYGDDIARYQFGEQGGRLDLGMNIGNQAQLRVGYIAAGRRVELSTGSPLLLQIDTTDAGIAASAIYDSRDTPFRATRGVGGSSAEAQAAAPRMISGSFFRLPRRRSGSISRRAGEWRARVGTAPIGKTP